MNKKYARRFSLIRGAMAIGIALLVAIVLIIVSSEGASFGAKLNNAFAALYQMLVRPIFKANGSFSLKGFSDVLAGMIPILFTGMATCVMFSANQFNLGAEGGIMLGAFVASLVAIYVPVPGILLPIVAVIVAAIVVGCVMLVPAVLKAKLGVSEMVVSLMMNYIILNVIMFLLNTYFADRNEVSLMTKRFPANAGIMQIIDNGTGFSIAWAIGIIMVVVMWFFMYRTKWGYGIRMTGVNEPFTMYSGMNVAAIVILAQVIGGLLAGLGGGLEVLGHYTSYTWKSLPGFGWTGITVAILSGNNPAYVPLAAFFMSYLTKGCTMMSTNTDVPAQLINIIQSVIFVFFAAQQFLSGYRQKLVVKSAQEELAEKEAKKLAEGGVK